MSSFRYIQVWMLVPIKTNTTNSNCHPVSIHIHHYLKHNKQTLKLEHIVTTISDKHSKYQYLINKQKEEMANKKKSEKRRSRILIESKMLGHTHKFSSFSSLQSHLNKLLGDVKIGPFFKLIDLIQPFSSELFQCPLISAVNYTNQFYTEKKTRNIKKSMSNTRLTHL